MNSRNLAMGLLLALGLPASALAEDVPSGYVLSIDLKGEDAVKKTAILRQGNELAPKLMMPLYEKDVIFLRDAQSSIAVEVNGGEEKTITGMGARFEVVGEVATGDDAWSLIAAVAGVIGGAEEKAIPDNMAARGDVNDLKIPMAVRGPNFLTVETRKLWLAWSGGKAPYKVIIDVDGRAKVYDRIMPQEFAFDTPPAAVERFTATVKDSEGRIANVIMRYRNVLPVPNEGFTGKLPEGDVRDLAYAAWMTGLHDGDWTIGAAQILKASPQPEAQALLAKIVDGWKLGQ